MGILTILIIKMGEGGGDNAIYKCLWTHQVAIILVRILTGQYNIIISYQFIARQGKQMQCLDTIRLDKSSIQGGMIS